METTRVTNAAIQTYAIRLDVGNPDIHKIAVQYATVVHLKPPKETVIKLTFVEATRYAR
ncbi:hypothetical protein DPMN_000151 [Dreissena polymorpha]|uniref:Uncharacterized protein n=1 Tax=Dreissena polymorpha TaxID=45954 RepID=A0A9D4MJ71_DREPO|nr:hypothetical protein DPMN_000151 [Dreissena polymorpha]